jgi:hypothetical protein
MRFEATQLNVSSNPLSNYGVTTLTPLAGNAAAAAA